MYKVVPLSSSFTAIGLLGFMAVVVYTAFGKLSTAWGFSLGLIFVIMIVSSMISMIKAPIESFTQEVNSKKSSAKKK